MTGPMLQEKAKRASEELGDSEFTVSNRWLDRFKKRFKSSSKVIGGEAGGFREETARALTEYLERLLPRTSSTWTRQDNFFEHLQTDLYPKYQSSVLEGKNQKKE